MTTPLHVGMASIIVRTDSQRGSSFALTLTHQGDGHPPLRPRRSPVWRASDEGSGGMRRDLCFPAGAPHPPAHTRVSPRYILHKLWVQAPSSGEQSDATQPETFRRFRSRDHLKLASWVFPLGPLGSPDFPRFLIASKSQCARQFSVAPVRK